MARHDFRIRKAEGQDAKGILACLRAAFDRYRAQYTPEGFADTLAGVIDDVTLRFDTVPPACIRI